MTQDEIDNAKCPSADPDPTPEPFTAESIFCVDCGMEFLHTAAEKTFFARMGYTNKPKRCVACRRVRKEERGGAPSTGAPPPANDDEFYDIVCSACSKPDRVPFAPKPGRDVFCHACHLGRVKGKRGEGGDGGGGGGGKRARRDGCPARK